MCDAYHLALFITFPLRAVNIKKKERGGKGKRGRKGRKVGWRTGTPRRDEIICANVVGGGERKRGRKKGEL